MGVEAVHQIDDPLMGITTSPFRLPVLNGVETVAMRGSERSTYVPGQVLNFRTWFQAGVPATNVILTVVSYDAGKMHLRIRNEGRTPGVEGLIVPGGQPVYLQDYSPTVAMIGGNILETDNPQGALAGVASNSKAHITGNFIRGYNNGVMLFENVRNLISPPTPGTMVDQNVILTCSPATNPGRVYGVQSWGPGDFINQNLIVTPISTRFVGVGIRGKDSWIEGNVVIPAQVVRQSYSASTRSVGIGFHTQASQGVGARNATYGLDVGIGPEIPFQATPHRVLGHSSTNDVLAIDPAGLLP